jgi:hypothetical protein
MPEEAFVNFAYSIILGIMATYGGEKNEWRKKYKNWEGKYRGE